MKASKSSRDLESLTDEELMEELARVNREVRRRITVTEKRVDRMRAVLPGTDHVMPRRKRSSQTPVHREISRLTQLIRHARDRKEPKAEIEKLEAQRERARAKLRREAA
jgi:hypothetical protein